MSIQEIRAIETEIVRVLREPSITVYGENALPNVEQRFRGTDHPSPGTTVDVPITTQIPDEWYASNTMPSVNVWRVNVAVDPTRFRTGFHRRQRQRFDGSGPDVFTQADVDAQPITLQTSLLPYIGQSKGLETKDHQIPLLLMYEFGIMARFQDQMIRIQQHLLKRFRPLGYKAFLSVTVNPTDGEAIEIPYRQINFIDLTQEPQAGEERRFEFRHTFEMLAWFDQEEWAQVSTVGIPVFGIEVEC